jgi:hypothetical protein
MDLSSIGGGHHLAVDDLIPLIGEQQQLVELGHTDLAILAADRSESRQRQTDIGIAHRGCVAIAPRCADQRRRTRTAGQQFSGIAQADQRGDHRMDIVDTGAQLLGQAFEGGEIVALVEVGDRGALLGGEQQQHGLSTEEILVVLVVDGDLRIGIQIRVLAGGELDIAQTEIQQGRDGHHRDQHHVPEFAEIEANAPPEVLYRD